MEAVLIIFMVLASIIGIGSTVIVTMTVVRESKERKAAAKADCDHCEKIPDCDSCDKVVNCDECEYKKVVEEAVKAYVGKEKAYACAETTATERCVAEDVATEPDAEEAEVVKATESPEGNVAFSATRETIDERYLALPGEYKNYYDEIVKHAASIEKSKRYKNARYEEYKVGKTALSECLSREDLWFANSLYLTSISVTT